MYDHLNNREPTNLCFFTLHQLPSQDLSQSLYNREEKSLSNCWDYFDLIKVNALKRGILPVAKFKSENLDAMSLYELKVTYWILRINGTVKNKNSTDQESTQAKEIELAKSYIFLYSASSYLQQLAEQENLSDTQKLSMSLIRNHLEIWYAGEEEEAETHLSKTVKKIVDDTKPLNLIHQEQCNFCQVKITEPWASACLQGHKLPRCALTRLQVTCTKYRSCPICREIYHPCLDDARSEIKCIYCDIPAVYMHLKIDSELLASERNLSNDKQIFIGSNKDKDKDKDEEDEA